MPDKSIFTRIIEGELPSHKIYEDDKMLAFLDIYPAVVGQTVVVPKKQVEFVWDLANDDYQALMQATKLIAKNLREKLSAKYVGVKIEGVEVPHAHIKVYPFNEVAEFNTVQDTSLEPNHDELAGLALKLKIERSS